MNTVAFVLISILTIAGALAAVMLRPLIHAVLCLVVAFVGVAAFFFLLGVEFVGLVQVLVYVGAVAVLVVFTVLLTRGKEQGWLSSKGAIFNWRSLGAALIAFLPLLWVVRQNEIPNTAPGNTLTVLQIGQSLMADYVWPLEMTGLLLTAALIGALILVMEEKK